MIILIVVINCISAYESDGTWVKPVYYRPPIEYPFFDFSVASWSDEMTIRYLRFSKEEFYLLRNELVLDDVVYESRLRPSPDLPLALLLLRLSYPHRVWELTQVFGRSPSYLSQVWMAVVLHLDSRFGRMIEWHPTLTYRRIKHFARCLDRQDGGGIIWGWLDGTLSLRAGRRTISGPPTLDIRSGTASNIKE
jgi:hypothetical protein